MPPRGHPDCAGSIATGQAFPADAVGVFITSLGLEDAVRTTGISESVVVGAMTRAHPGTADGARAARAAGIDDRPVSV
jgi:hypothetical protein